MKLLDDIITDLSSESSSLTGALLKTKILLHQIGRKELVDWVNHELNGYPDDTDLPEYRKFTSLIMGDVMNLRFLQRNCQIPISHLDTELRDWLTNIEMSQSLSAMQQLLDNNPDELASPIPMEFYISLSRQFGNGYMVQKAWRQISVADIAEIFIQVRSRLLDFVLGLQDTAGKTMSEEEFKKQANAVAPGIFSNAIHGPIHAQSIVFNVGNQNTQTISNVMNQGDIAALEQKLKDNKVDSADIAALNDALSQDETAPELAEKKYGPAVRGWLGRMLSKAADTSWNIEVSIAANLLTDALKAYYGWLN